MSEILKLRRPVRKRWLSPERKFRVNISYASGVEVTDRTVKVSDAFGMGIDKTMEFKVFDYFIVDITKKDVVYITGDSGSGKSVLLRWLKEAFKGETVDMEDVQPDPDVPLVEQIGETFQDALTFLSKAGLNDAFLFVRRYCELSDGQKYRFKIAKMMESEKQFWVMDEFCSTLDRDTAKVVAFNVQKLARKNGRGVFAATCHTDLQEDLKPSVYVYKRYGKEASAKYFPNRINRECSLSRSMRVVKGSYQDWKKLAHFHYRSHRVAAPRNIFCLVRGDSELCGVIVYCYSPVACFGRKHVLPTKMSMKELNEQLSTISRVVVHPKYRTIGLGHKLIRETLEKAGTPCVELIAVMSKYNPFAEKAGMTRIMVKDGSQYASRIADVLRTLGFNMHLLSSVAYVKKKLESLSKEDLKKVREALIVNNHPRFVKSFFAGMPYGKHNLYHRKILTANTSKIANLIRISSLLLQSKVYLFWKKPS
ncbi:GNAT family N-acetyltransferase [Candidatus Bathyarchaeota archaeon]|nr:GNAT family N-acetyltransferase [Candidatus Bathyarchaeota archaeon]